MKVSLFVAIIIAFLFYVACENTIINVEKFGWNQLEFHDMNVLLNDVYFIDSLNGWVLGGFLSTDEKPYGSIYKSSNGGKSWTLQKKEDSLYLYKIFFLDKEIGWAAGSQGKIYSTIDGGANWNFIETERDNDIRSIFFLDNNNGWLAGTFGTLLHTTNAGNNWEYVNVDISHFLDVYFYDENIGFVCGGSDDNGFTTGEMFKTTDGGKTWNSIYENNDALLRSMSFIDQDNGWASGDRGLIIRTTDGGITWEKQKSNPYYSLYSINFVDKNNGWVCGDRANVFATTNGGELWTKQRTGGRDEFYDIYFLNSSIGWVVGRYGNIYYSDIGGYDIIAK